jgi:glycosyltransferase involved in cell wall biosynthesis
MPRVSVIMPAFNAEAHIAEALASIVAQTSRDWEVVVGDDGSTDRTPDIAAQFGTRVKVARSEANRGPSAARNLAISHSSGELLAFLDSDDYWLPNYLEHQVGLCDTRRADGTDVGIVACNARILGPDGFLPGTYGERVDAGGDVTVTRLLRSNPIFASAISPRRVVDQAGGFCVDLRGTEDHDLWLRIVELGHTVVLSRTPLAVYRIRRQSLSADPGPMAVGSQAVLRRALERGNLTARQRRIAHRELRLHQAIERITSPDGLYRRLPSTLPLLVRVAAEHPRRWPSFARVLASRGRSLSRFAGSGSHRD